MAFRGPSQCVPGLRLCLFLQRWPACPGLGAAQGSTELAARACRWRRCHSRLGKPHIPGRRRSRASPGTAGCWHSCSCARGVAESAPWRSVPGPGRRKLHGVLLDASLRDCSCLQPPYPHRGPAGPVTLGPRAKGKRPWGRTHLGVSENRGDQQAVWAQYPSGGGPRSSKGRE